MEANFLRNDTSLMPLKKQLRKPSPSVRKSNNLLYDNLVYNGASDVQTNITLTSYDKLSVKTSSFDHAKDLIQSIDMNKVNWIHISGLKNVEVIGDLCGHFGLQVPAIQDILNVSHISKIEETNNILLVILDAYGYNEAMSLEHEHLSVILGSHFVISFEETGRNRFELVNKALESNIGLVRSQKSDYLFNLLVSIVVDSYLEVLELQQNALMDMEDLLIEFNLTPKETGQKIQHFRKDYSKLKKSILPLREHFGHLILMESGLIAKNCLVYYRDTYDHLQQVSLMMDANRETIASLVDLYLANNDLRMNQIMKQLTVVSTVFIPLTFLVGVWGMNFRFMPELEWAYGYLFAWLVMIVLGAIFYFWLRQKKMF
ncbi:MAG: magnesium/cobalt transporter CorA [Bacteroidales bacterium]|nr:magnesium/cobalt transporter CorA [Bacteroidales bacterium]